MKNSLSKALLCGVVASTFILVNCQKAPNRGVKAQVGAGTSADKLAGKKVAECTPSFLSVLKEARDLKEKIAANVKASIVDNKKLTDEQIDEIKKVRLEILAADKKVTAEMEKMKVGDAAAEACKTDKESNLFSDIKSQMAKIILDSGKVGGVQDVDQERLEKEKTEKEKKEEANKLQENAKFVMSAKLAEEYKIENNGGVIYFKGGEIIKESASYEVDKADKTKTICILEGVSKELKKLDGGEILTVLNFGTPTKVGERYELVVPVTIADSANTFKCQIADKKEKDFRGQFRGALGKHLQTQKQIDDAELAGKSGVEKAQADLDKKEKNVATAFSEWQKLNVEVETKDKEAKEASENKDNSRAISLTNKKDALKIKADEAEAVHQKAIDARDAAQKALDAAKAKAGV
jgi:hypothetical protein